MSNPVNLKHGYSRTYVYAVWVGMKYRCSSKKSKQYRLYGARGIKVCKRWLKFENFLSDMGNKPVGMSLERVNNNGNYTPSNCRWATSKEQSRNTRANRIIKYLGVSKNLKEWADSLGVTPTCIYNRLNKRWSIEKTLTTPSTRRGKILYRGEEKTLTEWAKVFNIRHQLISSRLARGWSFERAVTK